MSEVLSCFDPRVSGGRMMPVKESQEHILAAISVLSDTETIPLARANHRVLAADQVSGIHVPQQTNSAMDGFAIRAADRVNDDSEFHIVGRLLAGHHFDQPLAPGEALEIMTGAPLPSGADTIVIKEVATVKGDRMTFQGPIKTGQHVRHQGEDITRGQVALSRGTLLRAQEQGLLASVGLEQVEVFRRVRVAVFSTGDEVAAQGQPLPQDTVYDTNRFTLQGMLAQCGCEVIDLGIIQDNRDAMVDVLNRAAEQADLVISSGGVSMGEADFVKDALEQVGEINFWRIAMRPGRPLAFGCLNGTSNQPNQGNQGKKRIPFFGLPGNPVAVMVCFMQFVQPALRKLMGQADWHPMRMTALAEEPLKSRLGRTDYTRGIYQINDQGQLTVRSTGSQGSGILTSMIHGNCLIEITDDQEFVQPGLLVLIQPFSDLI
jgi:molybdopterin molybdotransferase